LYDDKSHSNTVAKSRANSRVDDGPLYALGKQIQWRFPDLYSEDKYVMMMAAADDVPVSEESFTEWCEQISKTHPMFQFWSTVLSLAGFSWSRGSLH